VQYVRHPASDAVSKTRHAGAKALWIGVLAAGWGIGECRMFLHAGFLETVMGKTIFRILALVLLCSTGFAGCASAPAKKELDASVRAAESVLAGFQDDQVKEALRDRLKKAKAIMIVSPGVDRGVVLARKEPAQEWSGPAFYHVTRIEAAGGASGGAGFTAGKQNIELIALAMTDKALAWFMSPQLPGASGMTFLHVPSASGGGGRPTDMVLFTRTEASGRAGNAGITNFDGTIVSPDKAGNQSYYGRPATPAEILIMQSVTSPDAASLQEAVAAAAQ
jgi:SH3 domain-containing YSC84-like protein 1